MVVGWGWLWDGDVCRNTSKPGTPGSAGRLFLISSPLPFQLGLHGLLREREAREAAMVRAGPGRGMLTPARTPRTGGGGVSTVRAVPTGSDPAPGCPQLRSPSPPRVCRAPCRAAAPGPLGLHLCPPGLTPCASPLPLQGFSHHIAGVPSWLMTAPTICHLPRRCQPPGTPRTAPKRASPPQTVPGAPDPVGAHP